MMKKACIYSSLSILLIFCSGLDHQASAQVIFSEPFNEAGGAMSGTDNTGGVAWTSVCPTCVSGDHYFVAGGQLEGQDTNGPATWETGSIDISSCDFIAVSFNLTSQGVMEACGTGCNSVDWVQFQYNIDGTGWQNPSNSFFCGGLCAGINVIQADEIPGGSILYSSGCLMSGNTLQLRIVVQAWAADEYWRVDNVTVSCTTGPTVGAGTDQTVCEGNPVTLTASNPGGASISWNNGVTNNVSFTPPVGTTTYTVTATQGACFATDQVDVIVEDLPSFFVTGNNPTSCTGSNDGEIILSGLTPSTSYEVSYYDGTSVLGPFNMMSDGSGDITITGLSAGTYTDFVVGPMSCSTMDITIITLTDPVVPAVDAGTDQTICEGDAVTLTASNPNSASISWDNGVTDGIAFTPSTGTITYTVTATLGACTNTDEVDVTVSPGVSFSVSGNDLTSCTGPVDGQLVISGLDPSTSYDVSYDNGTPQGPFTLMSNGSGVITVSNLAAGSYTDFLVELGICSAADASVINLVAPNAPTVDAGTNQTVCEGTPVTLTASNPDGVSISWSGGVTDGVAFVQPVGTINYTVTALDVPSNCSATDVVTVTVIDIPLVNINPAGPFSLSSGIQLMTATPSGGTWSADCGTCINASTGNFNPATAGIGTWEICYTAGTAPCDQTTCIFVTVTENCLLDGTINANNPTCFGFTDGSVTMNVTGASGTPQFTITNAAGSTVNIGNSNTANNLPEGWYYFDVTDDVCGIIDSVLIEDPGQMTIDLTVKDPACYGISNGMAIVDTVVNYTGSYAQIGYFWNPNPSGLNGIGKDSCQNLGEGSYNLIINDQNGCSASFDFVVTSPDSLYLVEVGSEPAYCRLFSYQSGNGVVFAAAAGGTPDFQYTWTNLNTGATSSNTTWGGLNPGEYQIQVTDDNGCVLTETITLDSLNPIADFELTSAELSAAYEGNAVVHVHLENQSQNYANPNDPNADTTFFWHFGFDDEPWLLSEDITESFDVEYTDGGEYNICLVALNKNGCADTSCVMITVYDSLMFTPVNVFTPNSDGANDVFTFNDKAASVEVFECVIVDRWGVVVYEMHSIADAWDGTDKGGNTCTSGVYFYHYELTSYNGIEMEGQGTVHLVRVD